MEFSMEVLMAGPMIMLGMVALIPVVIVLALTLNGFRVLAGLAGFAAGYVFLGTQFAYHFAEDARRRGACPDAGWLGPAVGGLLGVVVGVIVFEVVRALVTKSTKGPRAA